MASRIPNRSRANGNGNVPANEQLEEQENENEALIPVTEDDEENLPAAVGPRDVSAAEQVAIAKRAWYENLPGWIPRYLREAIVELAKVTWPTRKEAVNLSTVVVIFSIIFGIAFFLIDSGLTSVLQVLVNRIHP